MQQVKNIKFNISKLSVAFNQISYNLLSIAVIYFLISYRAPRKVRSIFYTSHPNGLKRSLFGKAEWLERWRPI